MASYIKLNENGFTCLCGNNQDLEGAFPIDEQGNETELPPFDDDVCSWRCDRCGLVFDECGNIRSRGNADAWIIARPTTLPSDGE